MAERKQQQKRSGSTSRASSSRGRTASGSRSASSRPRSASASGSSSSRSASTRARSSGSRSASSRGHTSSAEPSTLDKESLVERLSTQLRKLKKDELVSLVERVEGGTLDFRRLVTAGDGGFGFQERLEHGSSSSDDEAGPAQKAKGALDAAKGALGVRR